MQQGPNRIPGNCRPRTLQEAGATLMRAASLASAFPGTRQHGRPCRNLCGASISLAMLRQWEDRDTPTTVCHRIPTEEHGCAAGAKLYTAWQLWELPTQNIQCLSGEPAACIWRTAPQVLRSSISLALPLRLDENNIPTLVCHRNLLPFLWFCFEVKCNGCALIWSPAKKI